MAAIQGIQAISNVERAKQLNTVYIQKHQQDVQKQRDASKQQLQQANLGKHIDVKA